MIQQIEIDIQNSLWTEKNLKSVTELLWEKWKDANFDLFSINSFCSFLFEAQEWEKLILLSISQIHKSAPVSWDYLGETLSKVKDKPLREKVLQACINFFQDPKYEIPFLRTFVFDPGNPQVSEWRSFFLKQQKRLLDERRATLLDQLHMFKHSNNFSDYEKNLLIKLERMYPKDPEVMKLTEGPKIKEFKEILKKYGHAYPIKNIFSEPELKTENKFKNILINDCKKLIRDSDNDPFDFVYLFVFIGAHEEAIQLLERIPDSDKNNWLMMDLLMLAKRYTQALAWTDQLEENNSHECNIDKLSQIYYNRARCLWELSRRQLAIETIESLLKWNPEYRIANHLLYEWKSAV